MRIEGSGIERLQPLSLSARRRLDKDLEAQDVAPSRRSRIRELDARLSSLQDRITKLQELEERLGRLRGAGERDLKALSEELRREGISLPPDEGKSAAEALSKARSALAERRRELEREASALSAEIENLAASGSQPPDFSAARELVEKLLESLKNLNTSAGEAHRDLGAEDLSSKL